MYTNIFENLFNHNGSINIGNILNEQHNHSGNQQMSMIPNLSQHNLYGNLKLVNHQVDHLAQNDDDLLNRQSGSTTTYASVLTQGGTNQQQQLQQHQELLNNVCKSQSLVKTGVFSLTKKKK